MGHFQALGCSSRVEVAVVLSKLLDQESGICSAAEASCGGGWKGTSSQAHSSR
jgi:hypothetical protein